VGIVIWLIGYLVIGYSVNGYLVNGFSELKCQIDPKTTNHFSLISVFYLGLMSHILRLMSHVLKNE